MPPTRKTQKATARTRKTTIATHRVSATDKFKVEAARKKASPLAIVLGLAGVAVVASVAMMFLMGGKNDGPPPPDDLIQKAAEARGKGDYDTALRCFHEALARIEGREEYKGLAVEIRAWIKELEQLIERVKAADAAWSKLDRGNLEAARKLKAEYGDLNRPWMAELDALIARLEEEERKKRDEERKLEWEVFRKSLVEAHGIDRPDGLYGRAIVDLKAYLPKVQRWRDRVAKAEELVAQLDGKCKAILLRMEHARDRKALFAQVEGSAVEADARKWLE